MEVDIINTEKEVVYWIVVVNWRNNLWDTNKGAAVSIVNSLQGHKPI